MFEVLLERLKTSWQEVTMMAVVLVALAALSNFIPKEIYWVFVAVVVAFFMHRAFGIALGEKSNRQLYELLQEIARHLNITKKEKQAEDAAKEAQKMEDMSTALTEIEANTADGSGWSDEKILKGIKYSRLYPQFQKAGRTLEVEWQYRWNRKQQEVIRKQTTAAGVSAIAAGALVVATFLLFLANINLASSSQRLADITEAAYQPLSLSLMEGREVLLYSPEEETWPTRIYVTNRTPTNLHLGSSEIWLNCENAGIKRIPHSLTKPLEGNTQTYFIVDIGREIYGNIEQKDKCTFNITVVATNGWDAKLLEVPFVQQ